MKKLTVVCTALLCSFLAYSQEVDVRIIPRVDVNTYVPTSSAEEWGVDFGNTSLYTLVEGTFLGNFSYSVANHWLSVYGYETPGQDIAGLYTSSLYSDSNNWLDWANITYTLGTDNAGSFEFTLGKDIVAIGGYEIDAYDWDSHFGMNSNFWNNACVYQWGGKVGYTTPSEMTSVYLQATTSPYGGMMFKDQQWGAYSLCMYGDYDWFAPIWSVNFLQYDKGSYVNLLSLGNQFYVGDFTLGLEWMNRARSAKRFFDQEMTLFGTLSYNLDDRFEFFGKAGWERFAQDATMLIAPVSQDYVFGGVGAYFYPLKDSQDLRVHAVVSANNWADCVSVNLGVTYNFSVFSK